MADFTAGPAEYDSPADPKTDARNSRVGVTLFVLYSVAYAGFIMLNVFFTHLMERIVLAGLNLAVVYGFALIAGAILVAFVYGWLCRNPVSPNSDSGLEAGR